MADDDEAEPVLVSWSSIYVTLIVSFAQGLIFYWFFTKQRKKELSKNSVDLYEPRQHSRKHRSPEPFAEHWIKAAWNLSEEETLRCVGLDSYMFVRFFRLGARITFLGTLLSLVLIPVYATGELRGEETEQFNQWTLARVEEGSDRMWATVVCWWIFCGFILREFWEEWALFSVNRSKFLAHGDEDMSRDFKYAAVVEQIPKAYRNKQKLKQYFERLFPQKVREATVYLHAEKLQSLVDERLAVLIAMEKAEAFIIAKPDKPRPMVKVGANKAGCGGEKVDALEEHYPKELARLNDEIDAARAELLGQAKLQQEQQPQEGEPQSDVVEVDLKDVNKPQVETASDDKEPEDDGLASSTAIVTFTSLRAKQAAVQCEMTGKIDSFTVTPAPDPKGIIWNNITTPLPRQRLFQFQAAAFWTVGILFWALPVAFVTSIANLNSILTAAGAGEADPESFWYGLVSGLLPVIALAILMAVLYLAIVACATHFIKLKSMPEVDSYAFFWHMLYQFANLWLILIGGSAVNQIDAIIKDVGSIVEILAVALPGASIFFCNMIIVGSFGEFALELSMLPQYGVTLIMNIIQPEAMRTQRMLDEAKVPPFIIWGKEVPKVVFVFLVSIMYMPIVPIMQVFALVYFTGKYLVYKHQCLHVYAQEFEGGGQATWQQLFGFLMASLYMGEFVFIAYLGIKEASAQAALGFVPLAVTVMFHVVLTKTVIAPLKNLSLEVAADVDLLNGELSHTNDSDDAAEEIYGQPALSAAIDEREPMPHRRDAAAAEKEVLVVEGTAAEEGV